MYGREGGGRRGLKGKSCGPAKRGKRAADGESLNQRGIVCVCVAAGWPTTAGGAPPPYAGAVLACLGSHLFDRSHSAIQI